MAVKLIAKATPDVLPTEGVALTEKGLLPVAVAYHTPKTERKSHPAREAPLMISRSALREARRLGQTAVLLYLILLEKQGSGDRCYPMNADLATELNVTVKTIQRTLTKLADAGLIELLVRGNGRGRPSIWRVHPEPKIVHIESARKRATSDDERATFDDMPDDQKGDIPRQRATFDDQHGPERATLHDHEEGHIYVNYQSRSTQNTSEKEKPPYVRDTDRERGERSPQQDLADLMERREVKSVVAQYDLKPRLVTRSLQELVELWYQKDAAGHLRRPGHPNARARRAAEWLRTGEQTGKHARWRREASTEMAGLRPV